ncbi:hypothetical protein PC129_g21826 [Phytophthora cactorum]|uniref:Uncharacterized protein n=1 Tax=Phytophthora cactorum TaxID=29920 RepID=A0A8T1H4Z8_9STRA|nr:hypothetical protein Pcac1_g28810 [Phytophthora cactorum]KAG2797469.1 hypothetical protein PC112_g21764 [Phytophthora cactorum]KAG2874919.1 hypothetical protein PC114_g25003 [Phytophthora cactorum]KAG2888998.1 hypothetical protein PC117_g24786 [Phytophthora cactorum]KAG2967008.1 hypothetical protein PC119_g24585 [Phytophthora cactorum]
MERSTGAQGVHGLAYLAAAKRGEVVVGVPAH